MSSPAQQNSGTLGAREAWKLLPNTIQIDDSSIVAHRLGKPFGRECQWVQLSTLKHE